MAPSQGSSACRVVANEVIDIQQALTGDAQTMGAVRELDGEQVRVDFNHRLAGQPLVFRVQILDVAVPGN